MVDQRAAAGAAVHRRVVRHEQVVRAGIDHFLQRATLDMAALADEMAISRATLYRVAGSRDALLADILAAIAGALLAGARAARTRPGFEGVVEVSRHFGEQLRSPIMERFLKQDAEAASRILYTPAGAVHETAMAAQLAIFEETGFTRQLRAGVDVTQLAYLYVRMVGTFLYSEYFTGRTVDFDELVPALRSLLHPH